MKPSQSTPDTELDTIAEELRTLANEYAPKVGYLVLADKLNRIAATVRSAALSGDREDSDAERLRALASALPSLIDASRERGRLQRQLKFEQKQTRHYQAATDERQRKLETAEAQLTDARSRVGVLEDAIKALEKHRIESIRFVESERNALRRSREQAIAAIEALQRHGEDGINNGTFPDDEGWFISRADARSILRGAQ